MSTRFVSAAALLALAFPVLSVSAQQNVPPAPATSAAATPATPAAAAPTFPKPDPANFTATSPSKETINAFLETSWGYDDARVWQIQAIQKTAVDGVSKVTVYIGDKTGKQKPAALQFFVLPDNKHIIAGEDVIPFGEHPYAEYRAKMQQGADGPYRGAAGKDFEIVEFADFQCPHCKEAQANMEKLATDFPKARIVFQDFPLTQHAEAAKAAAYGECVAKAGGSTAFFQFASAVFDGQDGLATPDGATLTLNSAVTKAGQDPAKIAECAKLPATTSAVEASLKLGKDVNVNQTPTLLINGRQVPANAPYDTIKQIIVYQEKMDGIAQ